MTPSEAYSTSSRRPESEAAPVADNPSESDQVTTSRSANQAPDHAVTPPLDRGRSGGRAWSVLRSARAGSAVVAGRSAGALARRLSFGGGTSLPGLVARRLDPGIATYLGAQLRHGSVVIAGTNGKTTTSGLTASVLRASGLRVWRNREGANLVRGVTAALIIRARPTGRLRWGGNAAAVFEVDEAALPQVLREISPRVLVATNLFRDQLDRYGEVDTITERWRDAIGRLRKPTSMVLNADDPAIASLADASHTVDRVFFGVESVAVSVAVDGADFEVVDTRVCPRCRRLLTYTARFYSHIGHWRCEHCGFARPTPSVVARHVAQEGLDATRFTLVTPAGEREVRIPLPGLYNVYNALAAVASGIALDVDAAIIPDALGHFVPAFGRAERIEVGTRAVQLLLAKNPTGMNEVLRALELAGGHPHMLLLLNDRAADGEDVSWIWDADFERVARLGPAHLTVGGTRAYDLALRLKYAGSPANAIDCNVARALGAALEHTPEGETLYVAPTYTALLEVRGELERRGYAPRYWEQRDA